jgi:hypothetical protein
MNMRWKKQERRPSNISSSSNLFLAVPATAVAVTLVFGLYRRVVPGRRTTLIIIINQKRRDIHCRV